MEKRLGKGVAQIIESTARSTQNYVLVKTEQVRPSKYQPRETFRPEGLEELKESIKRHGIIEPIIVRPIAHGIYELVAGERRWRAAQLLGIQDIPAIIRALTDQETIEYSLIENLQREDLNPLEKAKSFERMVNEFSYSHEQIAEAVGKDRSSIANTLRLLKLPKELQAALGDGKITEGHAKVLLALDGHPKQVELFRRILSEGLSVRMLEEQAEIVPLRSEEHTSELQSQRSISYAVFC